MMRVLLLPACLVPLAIPLIACEPSPKLPITGEIKLEFVQKDSPKLLFKLKNQTAKRISFRGIHEWRVGASPEIPRMRCFNSDQTRESSIPLIDGPRWEDLVIESGAELNVITDVYFVPEPFRELPGSRCRFLLEIYGGAIIESSEFEI